MDEPVLLPLGIDKVTGYTVVDASVVEWVRQWRWRLNPRGAGYAYRTETLDGQKRSILLHRELMSLPRTWAGLEVDHINHDSLDNRKINLRVVTHAQNQQNKSASRYAKSQYRGVYWHKARGKWAAQGRVDGKQHHLGLFASEIDAARVAAAWRRIHMPFSTEARLSA